jgi:hypothetical protein
LSEIYGYSYRISYPAIICECKYKYKYKYEYKYKYGPGVKAARRRSVNPTNDGHRHTRADPAYDLFAAAYVEAFFCP